jgi:T5SS/PEP-CTERM-associated repeat protein
VTPGNLSVGLAGEGSLLVEDGATVLVDSGNQNPAIPGDTLDIVVGGSATGVGELIITGAGSRVETRGIQNQVQVGLNGGEGDVLIEAGATLDTQRIRIGIGAGSDGEMTVSGVGSSLLVTTEHGTAQSPFNNFAGSATIGFGGTGALNILNGATAQVREGFTNNTTTGAAQFILGLGAGGVGTMLIDGAGSSLTISSATAPPPGGLGARLQLGDTGGDGHIVLSNGGALTIAGPTPGLLVGRLGGGTGVIDVLSGASFTIDGDNAPVVVGQNPGSTGAVNVDGAGSVFAVTSGVALGFVTFGNQAVGALSVTNGASAAFTNQSVTFGAQAGSIGSLLVSGAGSSVVLNLSNLRVGNNGVGNVVIEQAGSLTINDGASAVIGAGSGSGSISVTGAGSVLMLDGGIVSVVSGSLSVTDGGLVSAAEVVVSDGGSISGNGAIDANVTVGATGNGIINPGTSIGTLTIDGDFALSDGRLQIEIAGVTPGAALGGHDLLAVTGAAALTSGFLVFTFVDGFAPSAGDSFEFLTAGSASGNVNNLSIVVEGLAAGFSFDPLVIGATDATITAATAGVVETDTTLLFGSDRADVFDGGAGSDVLSGGGGDDVLTGGADADVFVFDAPLGAGNVDSITDFTVGGDLIHLDTTIFGIAPGALDASAFHVGAAATDGAHRIIYDDVTGALYFDPDGDGAGAAILFANLTPGLALTETDFFGGGP